MQNVSILVIDVALYTI